MQAGLAKEETVQFRTSKRQKETTTGKNLNVTSLDIFDYSTNKKTLYIEVV